MSSEKKVYKVNTKALKKLFIVAGTVFIIIILLIPIKKGINILYLKSWVWHDISKYNFEVKLPRAYKDISVNNSDITGISSSAYTTDTNVKINEEYVAQAPEVVYYGGNILNGISMMIQCLTTEKTDRTLDDIADSQHILVKIYYEDDYTIGDAKKEFVTVLDTDAVRTSTDLTAEEEEKTIVNYLVPMEDKEVTITFLGKKASIEKAQEEIEKIINQMKIK